MKLKEVLQNKFIQTIVFCELFLQLARTVQHNTGVYFTSEITNEPSIHVTDLYFVEYLPLFLLSFFSGSIADRFQPRRLILFCNVFSAICVGIFYTLTQFNSWKWVYGMVFTTTLLSQLAHPAHIKLLMQYVSKKYAQSAMNIFRALFLVFNMLAIESSRYLYFEKGIGYCMIVVLISFLISTLTLGTLPVPKEPYVPTKENLLKGTWIAVKYILNNRFLKLLVLHELILGVGAGIFEPLKVLFMTEYLNFPLEYFSKLSNLEFLFRFFGSILVIWLVQKVRSSRLILLGTLVNALAILCIACTGHFSMIVLFFALASFFVPFIQVGVNYFVFQHTENLLLARVYMIIFSLFPGFSSVGTQILEQIIPIMTYPQIIFLIAVIYFSSAFTMIPISRSQKNSK